MVGKKREAVLQSSSVNSGLSYSVLGCRVYTSGRPLTCSLRGDLSPSRVSDGRFVVFAAALPLSDFAGVNGDRVLALLAAN